MKPRSLVRSGPRRRLYFAALAYVSMIVGLISLSGWLGSGLYGEYLTIGALRERLAQFDARADGSTPGAAAGDAKSGSPFITGATITQAGAALQQRMERAVVGAGGVLLSSQLEFEDQNPKSSAISLLADVEIPQPALQGFLYDLEAGTPYVFVDTLSVQSPQSSGDQESSRAHVSIAVSGQWESAP